MIYFQNFAHFNFKIQFPVNSSSAKWINFLYKNKQTQKRNNKIVFPMPHIHTPMYRHKYTPVNLFATTL